MRSIRALDIERLLDEVVRTGIAQLLNLVVFDHARDADDPHIVHRLVAAHEPADFDAVDIGQHHVEHDQIGPEFLDQHAGAEAVVDAADLEAAVALQLIDDQFDQIFIVVDDEDLALSAVERVGRECRCRA